MFLGLTAIAMYNNYYYIMFSLHTVFYMIPNAIRASVGNSVASESVEKNYKDFNTFWFMYFWIRGIAAIIMMCLFQPFMNIWMGEDLMLPSRTMFLFIVYFVLLTIGDIVALYKDAAGLWWQGRYRVGIEAVANIILSFSFGYFWGINGILIATILTLLFLGNGYGSYIVFKHYLGLEHFGRFIRDVIVFSGIFVGIAAMAYYICGLIIIDGFGGLAIKAIISVIIPSGLILLLFRKHAYFKNSKELMANVKSTTHRNHSRKS